MEQTNLFEKKVEEKEVELIQDVIIDKDFVLRDDLKDWIDKEDSEGNRYRERIIKVIEEIGVENWFKLKGYPTNEDSIWKNRWTGSLTTLGEEIHKFDNEFRKGTFEDRCYYLWENSLPIEIWNDKGLFNEYKVGTKEYYDKQKEKEASDKKYNKGKSKTLFGLPSSEEQKSKKNEWEFKELGIQGETEFITYVNFESDDERGFELFTTKKVMKGFSKTKQVKKGEFETKLVCVSDFIRNDLEDICGNDENVFNTAEEIKEFIENNIECSKFASKKNKENIFFDCRRYFWKYENKEFKSIGWNCLNEEELKEQSLVFEKRRKEMEVKEKEDLNIEIPKLRTELMEKLKKFNETKDEKIMEEIKKTKEELMRKLKRVNEI